MWFLLGLASGLCWGVGDFIGGFQARRLPVLAVTFWSQLAGALLLAIALLARRESPVAGSIAWGLAAGLCGLAGLICFYRGLAIGTMSLVAPLGACGALVPVLVGLARGDRPGLAATLGMVAALGGILIISRRPEPPSAASHSPAHSRAALLLGLSAAVGFGGFFVLLGEGGQVAGGSAFWTVAGARGSSLALLLALLLGATRGIGWPGRQLALVALGGALDTVANLLFAVAATLGPLGLVSILSSLYPVATLLLGRVVLGERLLRSQWGGVALALAGVAMVSAR